MPSHKHKHDNDWFDDDRDDRDELLDGDAFNNTLLHLGTNQIDAMFRCRAESPASIDDRAFMPLLEVVLKPFEEFLSPERMEELWEWAYSTNYEMRKEGEPGLKYEQSKEQLQRCRREPRPVASEPKKPVIKKKKRRQ